MTSQITITKAEVEPFVGHLVSVELPPSRDTGRARRRFGHLDSISDNRLLVVDRQERVFRVPFSDVVRIGSSTDGSSWPVQSPPVALTQAERSAVLDLILAVFNDPNYPVIPDATLDLLSSAMNKLGAQS